MEAEEYNQILVDREPYQSDSDELEMDSIQFISLIVMIENEFNFEVPDDLLNITILNTIEKLATVMENLVGEGCLYGKGK